MITITRVQQAISEFIKVLRFGKNDVQTALQVAPAGIDSKPVKNAIAVHSTTGNNGESVILGYIEKHDNTQEGETRIFATDENGVEVFSVFLKRNGTIEIGGNTDNMVRYSTLNTALQTFANNLNDKLTTAFGSVPYTWPGVSIDVSGAKIDEVKTN